MNNIKTSFIALAVIIVPLKTFSLNTKTEKGEIITYEHLFKSGKQLTINNQRGKVKVEGWDQEKIYVKIVKKAPANKLSLINIDHFFCDNKARLKTSFDQNIQRTFSPISWFRKKVHFNDVEVDYLVKVPHKTAVLVKSKQGAIIVKNISDSLSIKAEQVNIIINNVYGNVSISAQHADIEARTIHGNVDIQSVKGDIGLNNISAPVTVQLTEGDIMAHVITGPLLIKAHKSDIIAEQITESVIVAIHEGAIGLKDIHGPLEVTSQLGDIEVENAQNSASVKTEKGSVRFIKSSKTKPSII